jgi:Holliday junction DNA helicase RuvA
LIREAEMPSKPVVDDFSKQVLDVMIHQLGHKHSDARRMIATALKRNPAIACAEDLFEEVYRGQKPAGADISGETFAS